jgi:hypothetical protein
MKSITNEDAMKLAHQLRTDGNLIWNIGAKIILLLPHEAVSVKNKNALNRALHEYDYLADDQCLDGTALAHFRMEAEEIMLDAEDWLLRAGIPAVQIDQVRRNMTGMRSLLTRRIGHMNFGDYLTVVESAATQLQTID